MPFIHGKINDALMVSCYHDDKTHYYQISAAGSEQQIFEMDVLEGAAYMSLFLDEHGNRYYYANNKVFYWKGAG